MEPNRIRFGLGGLTAQAPSGTAAEFGTELDTLLDAIAVAEAHGLDSAWASEHHFSPDSYLPSVLPVLAAAAARTTTITLGTNLLLAPLHHPVRLAEDGAVLDHLSQGRLLLGLGLGYRDEEFAGFGVTRSQRRPLTEHLLTVLRDAWDGGTVTPRPRTPGGPHILLGGLAEVAVRRAARRGDGWIAPLLPRAEHAATRIGWLLDERRAATRSASLHVVLQLDAFVADHDAADIVRDGVRHVHSLYEQWLGPGHRPGPVLPPPITGTPDECAAAMRPWVDLLRSLPADVVPHLTVRLLFPHVAREQNLASVERFATEVVPRLTRRRSTY